MTQPMTDCPVYTRLRQFHVHQPYMLPLAALCVLDSGVLSCIHAYISDWSLESIEHGTAAIEAEGRIVKGSESRTGSASRCPHFLSPGSGIARVERAGGTWDEERGRFGTQTGRGGQSPPPDFSTVRPGKQVQRILEFDSSPSFVVSCLIIVM